MQLIDSTVDFLSYFGITAPLAYNYFFDALELILEQPERLRNVDSMIFPLLAEKYHKNAIAVSRTFCAAVKQSWKYNQTAILEIMNDNQEKCPTVLEVLLRGYLLIQTGRHPDKYVATSVLEPLKMRISRGYIYMVELINVIYQQGKHMTAVNLHDYFDLIPLCKGISENAVHRSINRFLQNCEKNGDKQYWQELMPVKEYNLSVLLFLKQVFLRLDTDKIKPANIPKQSANTIEGFLVCLGVKRTSSGYPFLSKAILLCLLEPICFTSLSKYIYGPIAAEAQAIPFAVHQNIENTVRFICLYNKNEFFDSVFADVHTNGKSLEISVFLRCAYDYFYKNGFIDDFVKTKFAQWKVPVSMSYIYLVEAIHIYEIFPSLGKREIFNIVARKYGIEYGTASNCIYTVIPFCWRGGCHEIISTVPKSEGLSNISFEIIADSIRILRKQN